MQTRAKVLATIAPSRLPRAFGLTIAIYERVHSEILRMDLRISQTFSNVDNHNRINKIWAFDCYRLHSGKRVLLRKDKPMSLQPKAMEILLVLIQRPGEVVSKDELMQAVWGDAFVEEANLSQSIFVLRRALGERASENRYIATIPGRGYRFVASVKEVTECIEVVAEDTIVISDEPQNGSSVITRLTPGPKWAVAASGLVLALIFSMVCISPKVARSLNNRGIQHQQKGEIRAAIQDYRWALRFSPGNAAVHYDLGDAYEEIPDYGRALEQYQRAIDLDPSFYPAYNNLSRLYILRRKDYGTALRLLDRALSMDPQEASVKYTIHKNYGWANLELGQLFQAEENLKLAAGLQPERGSAHCLLAKTLTAEGKLTDTAPEWELCLAYSGQAEVEPEWRNEAQENLAKSADSARVTPARPN